MTPQEIREVLKKHRIEEKFRGEKGAISQYEASRCIEEYTPKICVEIIHDLLAMLVDYIDYEDVLTICDAFTPCSTTYVGAWVLYYYIKIAPESDKLTGKNIAYSLYRNIPHEDYIEFFNEVQKWTKRALEEMGENTDV